MGNKEIQTIPINKEHFMKILRARKQSLRKIDDHENAVIVKRSEKSVREYLKKGQIPPEVLDNLGKWLDVYPPFLSGELHERAKKIKYPELRGPALRRLTLDKYPYVLQMKRTIEPKDLFVDILNSSGISVSDFCKLPYEERSLMIQEMWYAIQEVITKHFKTDSSGEDNIELLDRYRDMIGDPEPIYYMSEIEEMAKESAAR